jgi:hypothetical protein
VALAAIFAAQPAIAVVQHNLVITRDDTRVLAARWAIDNLSGKGEIAIDKSNVTLYSPSGGWADPRLDLSDQTRVHRRSLDEYRTRGYSFLVTSSYIQDRYFVPTTDRWSAYFREHERLRWPDERERAERLERRERPVMIFAPGPDGASVPFQFDDIYTPYWNLWAWYRPGPTIKVYALRG